MLLLGLVAAQFFKFDAAVAVDLAAFQAVRLNLLDDERPRHIEEVSRLGEIGVRFQLNSISDDCMKLKLGERADERDAALLLS